MSAEAEIIVTVANGEAQERIKAAVMVALQCGGIDGAHHKTWVIDQMLRALLVREYDSVIAFARAGKDGPETYDWDVGVPP